MAVCDVSGLREAIVGIADFQVGAGSEDENRVHLAIISRLARESLRVRMLGWAALDLAWLAAGRLNATVMLSNLPCRRDARRRRGCRVLTSPAAGRRGTRPASVSRRASRSPRSPALVCADWAEDAAPDPGGDPQIDSVMRLPRKAGCCRLLSKSLP